MSVKITLTNSSRITRPTLVKTDSKLLFLRQFYQRLSSLVANKTIAYDYANNKLPQAYKDFLDDLNKVSNGTASDEIIELDLYLGSLGITNEYPYLKDTVDIPPWFEVGAGAPIRYMTNDNKLIVNGNDYIVRIL